MSDGTVGAGGGAAVAVEGVSKHFGEVVAVDEVSLAIGAGEFVALLGPSGSGKTTILMSIAGFEAPTSGRVLIDGRDVTDTPVYRRNLGMVFQKYTLFPHLTVRDNVGFPLKMRGVDKAERRRRAEEALETVRLGGYGDRMPSQLSGGQQQRVALARAVVYRPRVLLMDEPLGALDRNLREEMQLEIKHLQAALGITVVFVTHDQEEALTMADRVAVMAQGRLQQIGSPEDLYERPANRFVAGFVGEMNFIPVAREGAGFRLAGGPVVTVPEAGVVGEIGAAGVLAVRPESLELTEAGAAGAVALAVRDVVYAGPSLLVIGQLPGGTEVRARMPSRLQRQRLQPGDAVHVRWPETAARLYPDGAAA